MCGFVFRKGGSFVSVLAVEQDRQSIVIEINGVGKAVDQPETMLEKFGIEFSEFREKEKNLLFCQRGTDISSFIICTVSSDDAPQAKKAPQERSRFCKNRSKGLGDKFPQQAKSGSKPPYFSAKWGQAFIACPHFLWLERVMF